MGSFGCLMLLVDRIDDLLAFQSLKLRHSLKAIEALVNGVHLDFRKVSTLKTALSNDQWKDLWATYFDIRHAYIGSRLHRDGTR